MTHFHHLDELDELDKGSAPTRRDVMKGIAAFAGGVLGAGLLRGPGALAQTGPTVPGDATYFACLYAGTLSQVGTTPPASCGRGTTISWGSGTSGVTGPSGPEGPAGPTGPMGATGAGAIVPFASGSPVTLSTDDTGEPARAGMVGFGNSVSLLSLVGGVINVADTFSVAFSVPRAGTITSLAAAFTLTTGLDMDPRTLVSVTARLFGAEAKSTVFAEIPGTAIVLEPGFSGASIAGSTVEGGVEGLSIPVAARTKLMLVATCSATGPASLDTEVPGLVSGGVGID